VKLLLLTLKLLEKFSKIGRNKSVGADGFAGEILKLCGEAMISFLARLLEISLNNAIISNVRKKNHSSSYLQMG
jgi:hypothetical protein